MELSGNHSSATRASRRGRWQSGESSCRRARRRAPAATPRPGPAGGVFFGLRAGDGPQRGSLAQPYPQVETGRRSDVDPARRIERPPSPRICTAAPPFSTTRIVVSLFSRSPDRLASGTSSSPASGGAPGAGAASSVGASIQKGDTGPASSSGSSQANRPHAAASRSAAVRVRKGKGAGSSGADSAAGCQGNDAGAYHRGSVRPPRSSRRSGGAVQLA